MRGVRPHRKKTENQVKKKIRAIQYGVGPIGASLARLMREQSEMAGDRLMRILTDGRCLRRRN